MKRLILFLCLVSLLHAEPGYILCVDGGGSKTTLQVIDQKGKPLSQTEAGGSNINVVGVEGVRAVLHTLLSDIKLDMAQCHVIAGMAGSITPPQNRQTITALFEEWGIPKAHIQVMSDVEVALGVVSDQGIVLIAGTGSVCFGKREGVLYRVGGLGRILGDEGSGYQIGLHALKVALAEEYGWGRPTSLSSRLKEHFQVRELKSLVPAVNRGEMLPAQIASSAPLVFQEAANHDALAEEVLEHAAAELGRLIATQLRIVQLPACELHLWGGLFKASDANVFIERILTHVGKGSERLKIVNNASHHAAALFALKHLVQH